MIALKIQIKIPMIALRNWLMLMPVISWNRASKRDKKSPRSKLVNCVWIGSPGSLPPKPIWVKLSKNEPTGVKILRKSPPISNDGGGGICPSPYALGASKSAVDETKTSAAKNPRKIFFIYLRACQFLLWRQPGRPMQFPSLRSSSWTVRLPFPL